MDNIGFMYETIEDNIFSYFILAGAAETEREIPYDRKKSNHWSDVYDKCHIIVLN